MQEDLQESISRRSERAVSGLNCLGWFTEVAAQTDLVAGGVPRGVTCGRQWASLKSHRARNRMLTTRAKRDKEDLPWLDRHTTSHGKSILATCSTNFSKQVD